MPFGRWPPYARISIDLDPVGIAVDISSGSLPDDGIQELWQPFKVGLFHGIEMSTHVFRGLGVEGAPGCRHHPCSGERHGDRTDLLLLSVLVRVRVPQALSLSLARSSPTFTSNKKRDKSESGKG